MLTILIALIYLLEWCVVLYSFTVELLVWNLWGSFWFEFFFLQVFILYQIYKLFFERNLFNMLLALLYILILLCLYLALMQVEMFSCFLFLSEFILIVFFYCLFLHLNYTNKKLFWNNVANNTLVLFISVFVILVFWYFNRGVLLLLNINDLYLAFIDIYVFYGNYFMNDFLFLFFFFYHYNIFFFFFIGLFLLIMTTLLLYVVFLYSTMYISKKTFYKNKFFIKINNILWNNVLCYFI